MNVGYERRLKRLLLPYGLGIGFLFVVPAILSFVLAFFRYDALSPPRFVGTLNFSLARTDSLFNLSLSNSLALVILPVPLRVFGAFLAARMARAGCIQARSAMINHGLKPPDRLFASARSDAGATVSAPSTRPRNEPHGSQARVHDGRPGGGHAGH